MELLSYPKTEYLLDSSLESLHAESLAWLNELQFWGDELGFFYKLTRARETNGLLPTAELAALEKELVRLDSEWLHKTRDAVKNHERLLSSVVKSASMADEQAYRSAHRRLLGDMHNLHIEIRSFKRKVFSFVRKNH